MAAGRRISVLVLITILVLIVVGAYAWLNRSYLVVSVLGPGTPTVIKKGCPAVLPRTDNANEDFADEFVWQQRHYISGFDTTAAAEVHLGAPVLTITCSLADPSSTNGHRVAYVPWPDGTATGLDIGTIVYAVDGHDPACLLGVEVNGRPEPYSVWDLATGRTGC